MASSGINFPILFLSGLLFLLSWYVTVTLEKKDKELAQLYQKTMAEARGERVLSEENETGWADKHPSMLIIALILLVVGGLFLLETLAGSALF